MSNSKMSFQKRAQRVRTKVKKVSNGTPRLSVFRSGLHIYAQVIDDVKGETLASASTVSKDFKELKVKSSTIEAAGKVGELVAKAAKKASVETVVFDKGGYPYHGKVKALAESARAAGLKF